MLTVDPRILPQDVGMPSAVDVPGGTLKAAVLAGAGANTNIALAGIAAEDKIWKVFEFVTAAAIATLADRTANVSLITAGQIQLNVVTTGNALLVFWLDLNP
jgi:hypothetical protein